MSDLEEDLLALAGAGGSATEDESENEALHAKRASSSDQSQRKKKKVVEEDEDEDDDDDYNIDEGDGEDDGDGDGDDYDPEAGLQDNEDDEEDANPYPLEGKYKNERDRAELESMPEVEREAILFDRSQELQKFNERRMLRERAKQNKLQNEQRSSRSKKVKESAQSVKSSVRSKLKQQREKKSRKTSEYYDDEEEEEESEEDGYDFGDIEEDDYEPDFQAGSQVEWAETSKRRDVELKDINAIRTGHSIAEKFCFYPNFDEVIIGTFGRIRVSRNEHRMVKIDEVVKGKPYTFGESKLITDKYFKLSVPGKDRKIYPFGYLSDDSIKAEEFIKYKEYIRLANQEGKRVSLPNVSELEYKLQELKSFSKTKLEGSIFDEFMKNKSKLNKTDAGSNVLSQKLKIKQQLDVARDRNDFNEIQRLSKELNKVSQQFDKVTSNVAKDSITAKISERNRKLNNVSVRKAELINSEKKRTGVQNASDPFSRLTTRAKVYYQETKKIENDKAKIDALATEDDKDDKELLKASKYRSLGEFDKIINSIEFKFNIN